MFPIMISYILQTLLFTATTAMNMQKRKILKQNFSQSFFFALHGLRLHDYMVEFFFLYFKFIYATLCQMEVTYTNMCCRC